MNFQVGDKFTYRIGTEDVIAQIVRRAHIDDGVRFWEIAFSHPQTKNSATALVAEPDLIAIFSKKES